MNAQSKFPIGIAGAAERSHEEMKPVLFAPDATGPNTHYYMIRGGSQLGNITAWIPGTIGGEYIKAFGHYHITDFVETYTVIHGEGVMVMQKRGNSNDTLESFIAVKLTKGQSISIPAFWGHGMINTGTEWLITVDDSPVSVPSNNTDSKEADAPSHADYEPIRTQKGFGYYLVEGEKNAVEFIKNPTYTTLPEVQFFGNVTEFNQFIAHA
jgi:oxalate decarboxylase/phosphoglucose isomerase-like protein (cupin superfamily)